MSCKGSNGLITGYEKRGNSWYVRFSLSNPIHSTITLLFFPNRKRCVCSPYCDTTTNHRILPYLYARQNLERSMAYWAILNLNCYYYGWSVVNVNARSCCSGLIGTYEKTGRESYCSYNLFNGTYKAFLESRLISFRLVMSKASLKRNA